MEDAIINGCFVVSFWFVIVVRVSYLQDLSLLHIPTKCTHKKTCLKSTSRRSLYIMRDFQTFSSPPHGRCFIFLCRYTDTASGKKINKNSITGTLILGAHTTEREKNN